MSNIGWNIKILLGMVVISLVSVFAIQDIYNTKPKEEISHPVVYLMIPDTGSYSSAVHIGNGLFLTTNHSLSNGLEAQLLAQDIDEPAMANVLWISSRHDIALLHAPELKHIDSYELSCEPLHIGQPLTFHGNPAGLRSITTWGNISGEPFEIRSDTWETVVPVDGVILPGMSGGSVISNDKLVGIIVGTMTLQLGFGQSFTGISFIISSDILCDLLALN
jgi:S1-C subfamily serine protease